MSKDKFNKIINLGIFFLFILTPLFSAVLFCLKDGHTINDIYIPLGGWSDEITYYKQIEGILSHGMPKGYFGYNQSKALYGPLAVWGIIPLIPYIIYGFFFGWSYCAPIYANILFGVIALSIVYLVLRPQKTVLATISVFWILNQFLNRYVLSGVIEASVVMQLMIVIVCGEYLLNEQNKKQGRSGFAFWVCIFSICFLTLARPYFAVLYLIPLWKTLRDRQYVKAGILPVIAIVTIGLFFVNNYYFCSTYFRNVLSLDRLGPDGISGLFSHMINDLIEIAKLMWYAVRYEKSVVGWYYLLLCFELLVMICTCIYRKIKNESVSPMYVCLLVGNILILLSFIIMYDLGVGARHSLALIIVNAVVLIIEGHWSWGAILALLCFFSAFITQGAEAIPYQTAEYAAYMDELAADFKEVVHITEQLSYDNVVAMPTLDHDFREPEKSVCTYYGLMFAMPSGVGISLDFEDFYDDTENIKAGYILVHPDGRIRYTLEEMGMKCIYENKELMLYGK